MVCLSFSMPMFHNGFLGVASLSVDDPSSRRGFLENRLFQGRLGACAPSSAMMDGLSVGRQVNTELCADVQFTERSPVTCRVVVTERVCAVAERYLFIGSGRAR